MNMMVSRAVKGAFLASAALAAPAFAGTPIENTCGVVHPSLTGTYFDIALAEDVPGIVRGGHQGQSWGNAMRVCTWTQMNAVEYAINIPPYATFDASSSSPGWTCTNGGRHPGRCTNITGENALSVGALAGGAAKRNIWWTIDNPWPVTTHENDWGPSASGHQFTACGFWNGQQQQCKENDGLLILGRLQGVSLVEWEYVTWQGQTPAGDVVDGIRPDGKLTFTTAAKNSGVFAVPALAWVKLPPGGFTLDSAASPGWGCTPGVTPGGFTYDCALLGASAISDLHVGANGTFAPLRLNVPSALAGSPFQFVLCTAHSDRHEPCDARVVSIPIATTPVSLQSFSID